MEKGPVIFDLEESESARPDVAAAPPVPDSVAAKPERAAMQTAARLANRESSILGRLFWWLFSGLLVSAISISTWRFITVLMEDYPLVGLVVTVLLAAFGIVVLLIGVRELAAFNRLARIDQLRHQADGALANEDLVVAQGVTDRLVVLYRARPETQWGRERLADLRGDQLDATGLLALAEGELLSPLDALARREIEAAARQVATVTALVPLAFADVAAAFAANLRMIRRIAQIYGGRSGTLGSWRLTRVVLSHLVATGAVAVGDDLLEPVLGGTILGKLSRRFGEGFVNGALTARVGVAAMEVCRPLPFGAVAQPKARELVKSALTGVFGARKED